MLPKTRPKNLFSSCLVGLLALGCAEVTVEDETDPGASSVALQSTLNTFGTDYLQIDQLNGGPPDANLFSSSSVCTGGVVNPPGCDPADNTLSVNLPTASVASPTFIDWNDLASTKSDHLILDINNSSGKDVSSFPRANECV